MKICIHDYMNTPLNKELDAVLYIENDYKDPKKLEISFIGNTSKPETVLLKSEDYSRITIY